MKIKFAEFCKRNKLVAKQEAIIISIMFIVFIIITALLSIFMNILTAIFLSLLLALILIFGYKFRLDMRKLNMKKILNNDFMLMFTFLKMYVSNGIGVFTSFKKCLNNYNDDFKEILQDFINEIEEDKSIQPYIKLSSKFKVKNSKEILVSLYQMQHNGISSKQFNSFILIFDSIRRQEDEMKEKAFNKKCANLSMLPLIGAGLFTLIIMYGVILVMGMVISGI